MRLRLYKLFWIVGFVWSCGQNQTRTLISNRPLPCCSLTEQGELPSHVWSQINPERLVRDWRYQRESTWNVLSYLTQPSDRIPTLLNWQNWFTDEDLEQIFHSLYTDLGKDKRTARSSLNPAAIDHKIDVWQSEQKNQTLSGGARLFRTFDSKTSQAKGQSLPTMERILFNRSALTYMLQHYNAIYLCFKGTDRELCPDLQFPEGSAFLKTAWRRSGDGFEINSFPTDAKALRTQFELEEWTPDGSWLPPAGTSLTLNNTSGTTFHLVGLHLTLKFPTHWLWGSLWLSPNAEEPLSRDQPNSLKERWKHYQLCTAHSFESPFRELDTTGWAQDLLDIATLIQEVPSSNWCSNPFLEFGSNNQKTNCIGCHQHAGFDWSQSHLAEKLAVDPSSLQVESPRRGPGDFVWSVMTGANALAIRFADSIEYFDAYDPFE